MTAVKVRNNNNNNVDVHNVHDDFNEEEEDDDDDDDDIDIIHLMIDELNSLLFQKLNIVFITITKAYI